MLNIISIILESYSALKANYDAIFTTFEIFSVIVFTIEYFLRLWTADLEYKKLSSIKSKMKFAGSKLGLIDLISILPFYLPFVFAFDLRVLRILRLFRLLRIFKLGRFSKSMKTIARILKETKSDLAITLLVALVLLILSSTLMFYIEHDSQPDKFANIGQALWWSVATLTTVGYGDVYPITSLGKFFGAIIAIIGIGIIALPTGIISSAFINGLQKEKKKSKCTCPNCGTKF